MRELSASAGLDVAHPQLVEELLEQLPLFGRQVAARLRLEQRQDVDHLLRGRQVRLRCLPGDRIGNVAEVHGGGVRQRQHERGEVDPPSPVVV